MGKRKIYGAGLLLLLLIFSETTYSQEADSVKNARLFLQACSYYQRVPLRVNIEVKNSTNYLTNSSDTLHNSIEINMTVNRAYISMGPLEQLVDDSVILYVNNDAKQMILYPNSGIAKARMKQFVGGITWPDSSVQKFIKLYQVREKESGLLELQSRQLIGNTDWPAMQITVSYTNGLELAQLVETKRTAIEIDSSAYARLSGIAIWKGKLIYTEKGKYYLIKENKTEYEYKAISHQEEYIRVPVSGRLQKAAGSNYMPARGYEQYRLTSNM